MRTIAAQDATVGATYKNARGSLVTVTEIPPEPAQVGIRLASGTPTTVPRAYPLELVDAPPGPEAVAHGPIDAIRAAVVGWEVEDLEDLADLDQRPEVQDLVRLELGKRQAPDERIAPPAPRKPEEPPAAPAGPLLTCSACGLGVAALVSASGPPRVGVHADPSTGVYCAGSALPPKAPPVEPEAGSLAELGGRSSFYMAGRAAFMGGKFGSAAEAISAWDDANPDTIPRPLDYADYELGYTEAEQLAADEPGFVKRVDADPPAPVAPEIPKDRAGLPDLASPEAIRAGAREAEARAATAEVPKAANDRIKLIRTFTTLDQVEAAKAWPSYQAPSLDPEVKSQVRLLTDVATARAAGNVAELQRLAGLKSSDLRPGVMAMIRKAIAELQGAGAEVTPSARPVDPAELAPRPLTVTPEACPEDLAETLAELVKVTRVAAWSTEVVALIRDVLSNVRDGRAALQRTEDVVTLRLAWRLELISRRRTAILDQLRARVVALGGAEVHQEDLIEHAAVGPATPTPTEVEAAPTFPPPPPEGPDGDERGQVDPDGDGAEAQGAEAFQAGAMIDANPYTDSFYREAWEAGWVYAAGEAAPAAPPEVTPEPEPIGALPVVDQVAKATTARALELVAELAQPGDVDHALELERARAGGPRAKVVEALDARGLELVVGATPAPKAAAPPPSPQVAPVAPVAPKAPAGAPRAFQVQDLVVHQLPDGTEDLWAHVPGHRPALVGKVGDPKIAQAVELYRRHQAELNGKPGTARAKANDAATAAQAALAAFAAALPALSAMGLDVSLTITTRPPSA